MPAFLCLNVIEFYFSWIVLEGIREWFWQSIDN